MPSPRTARPIQVSIPMLVVMSLLPAACSQRVVPEEEYAASERERPLISPSEVRGTILNGPRAPSKRAVLFLYVRPAGADSGPPLAARRLPAAGFPADFVIGPGDAMLPGRTVFPQRVTVEARLDQDGDPMTTGAGDWTARSGPVAPGTGGIRLELVPSEPSGR